MPLPIELKVLDARMADTLPRAQTAGSAGMDLCACLDGPHVLAPGDTLRVNTGIAIHIHNADYAGLILPRSGLGSQGLVLANIIGLIDADYQGPLLIPLWNRSDTPIALTHAMRIAQLIIAPVASVAWQVVAEFGETSARGAGGFGHTGADA